MDLHGLPGELAKFVAQELQSGHYTSEDELVCVALRLLQKQKSETRNSRQFANGQEALDILSADDVLRAISKALADGEPGIARQLALDGAQQYPDHDELQKYAYVLAPPEVTRVGRLQTPSIRASRQWLRAHGQDYVGQWIAVRDGQLLYASSSFEELSAHIDEAENTLITQVY